MAPSDYRVLVIDDDELMRSALEFILREFGYQVEVAADGRAGLEACRNRPPDVIVTDIIMPEVEGIAVIMEIKRTSPKTRIIAMSGGGQSKDPGVYLNYAAALGAERTLAKPFGKDQLIEEIQSLLEEGT